MKTVGDLKTALEAANRAKTASTLLLEDGTYLLDIPALELQCPGLVIRSASGNREAVILRGPDEGTNAALANVFLVSANDVVIADLTLGYCRYHGIQVRGEPPFHVSGLRVHNCRLINCNQQFIKGSSSENDPLGATDGCIEQCLFEFTSGWAYQSYTGGIDIHKGVNWIVRDNLFRNLRVPTNQPGIAEHAVHFWKRCSTRPQNILVERNQVLNCDRGIGFGLSNFEGGLQGETSAIRNNIVSNDGTGAHTDVGIGLEYAANVHVDNNTVVVQKYWAPMEYRFGGSSNVVFRNNLTNRPIQRRDDAPAAVQANNLEHVEPAWFRNITAGDLRLTAAAKVVIDHGTALDDFRDDLDRHPRPHGAGWDIGACEFDPQTSAGLGPADQRATPTTAAKPEADSDWWLAKGLRVVTYEFLEQGHRSNDLSADEILTLLDRIGGCDLVLLKGFQYWRGEFDDSSWGYPRFRAMAQTLIPKLHNRAIKAGVFGFTDRAHSYAGGPDHSRIMNVWEQYVTLGADVLFVDEESGRGALDIPISCLNHCEELRTTFRLPVGLFLYGPASRAKEVSAIAQHVDVVAEMGYNLFLEARGDYGLEEVTHDWSAAVKNGGKRPVAYWTGAMVPVEPERQPGTPFWRERFGNRALPWYFADYLARARSSGADGLFFHSLCRFSSLPAGTQTEIATVLRQLFLTQGAR